MISPVIVQCNLIQGFRGATLQGGSISRKWRLMQPTAVLLFSRHLEAHSSAHDVPRQACLRGR